MWRNRLQPRRLALGLNLGDELAAVLATEETLPGLGDVVDAGGDDCLAVVETDLALLGPAGDLLHNVAVAVDDVEDEEAWGQRECTTELGALGTYPRW